jgi:uncharacterized membrane protein YraQ (UPF0718 family)
MVGTIVIYLLASIVTLLAWRRHDGTLQKGLHLSWNRLFETLPRMALALIAAGFIGKLVPTEPVARVIGPESGFMGILLAAIVGGVIPSGPMVSFPVLVVLVQAGAGFPQTCAFVTGWSVLAVHRVLIYELSLMGWQFSVVRLTSSLALPVLCGLFAQALIWIYPIKWPPW